MRCSRHGALAVVEQHVLATASEVPVAKGAEHCLAAPREGIEAYDALPERTLWKALDQLACDLVRQ